MILGIGSDLIDITRIERTMARFGERFLERIFTETERGNRTRSAIAPPATPSALPPRRRAPRRSAPGFTQGHLLARTRASVNLPGGRPSMVLTVAARWRACRRWTPPGMVAAHCDLNPSPTSRRWRRRSSSSRRFRTRKSESRRA